MVVVTGNQTIDDMLSARAILDPKTAMEEIANVGNWESSCSKFDWRPFVPIKVRDNWKRLSTETKVAVYLMAVEQLDSVDFE